MPGVETLRTVLQETAQVTGLVLLMMVLVDLLNVRTRGGMRSLLRGPSGWRQYLVAPLIAALPGCVGAFSVVSLYQHGMISFGALAGAMLAASGDEAFVMLALFPDRALLLFAALVLLGIPAGWATDRLIRRYRISTCEDCPEVTLHEREHGLRHYLRDHVWDHIIRRHLWRTALWTFGALVVVHAGMQHTDLSGLARQYPLALLLAAGLLGLIPESGPHLLFVTMFAHGLVPFSVLLTSSMVQDGHGMLPMLAHSVRASVVLKTFNLAFGIAAGTVVWLLGW
jgi:hypothetical protein